MNSETLQPVENEAPDQGIHLSTDERLSAVTREAVVEADNEAPLQAEDAEGVDEVSETPAGEAEPDTAEPEEDAEGHLAEDAEESQDEDGSQPERTLWDGNPDTVPDELQPGFDHMMKLMNKGVNKRLQQLAAAEKEYKDAQFRYEQASMQLQTPQPEGVGKGGPPKPPMQGATEEELTAYEAETAKYYYEKYNSEQGQQIAVIQQKQEMRDRLDLVTNLPGASDEIMYKMHAMAEADPRYLDYWQSDDGATRFFEEAKLALDKEAFAAEKKEIAKQAAEAAKAEAKRKASAARSATARPGGTKAASSPEEVFSRKSFKNIDEKLSYFRDN